MVLLTPLLGLSTADKVSSMLSSFNTGKYLTATYEREREACAQNKDRFTVADQAFYEISGQSPGMGDRDRMEDTFDMDGYDQRNKPEVRP
jgi:hypothetical protein